MRLSIVLPSGATARLGTFHPVRLADLRRYVSAYPLAWVNA